MPREPARRSTSSATPAWFRAFDTPVLQAYAYPGWIVATVVTVVLIGVGEQFLPDSACIALLLVFGLASGLVAILFSRPLAYSRDDSSWIVRFIFEGRWWGRAACPPWVFRLQGSATIGLVLGYAVRIITDSLTAGVVVGAVVGLGLWVWTWSVFAGIEEV